MGVDEACCCTPRWPYASRAGTWKTDLRGRSGRVGPAVLEPLGAAPAPAGNPAPTDEPSAGAATLGKRCWRRAGHRLAALGFILRTGRRISTSPRPVSVRMVLTCTNNCNPVILPDWPSSGVVDCPAAVVFQAANLRLGERLPGRGLGAQRGADSKLIARAGIGRKGQSRESTGSLPYAFRRNRDFVTGRGLPSVLER
jgi:hypothetical protein